MFLNELTITNVGPFSDSQTVKFSQYKDKPITLIGGENGLGKTTIINSLALVLFGSRSKRIIEFDNYGKYLSEMVHKGKERSEIRLSFTRQESGSTTQYELVREWSKAGNELFKCFIDGERDQRLTENSQWQKTINQLIPISIAGLAIFDGEKIEALANPARSNEILQTTIEGLLGLDLLTQLQIDLRKVEKNAVSSIANDVERNQISDAEAELIKKNTELEAIQLNMQKLGVQILASKANLQQVNDAFEELGGSLYEERHLIQGELQRALHSKEESSKILESQAGGIAPLLLIPELLQNLQQIGESSIALDESELLLTRFKERDEQILHESSGFLNHEQLNQLDEIFMSNREQHKIVDEVPFHVRPDIHTFVRDLLNGTALKIETEISSCLDSIRISDEIIKLNEEKIKIMPGESEATEILRKVHEAEFTLKTLEEKMVDLETDLKKAEYHQSEALRIFERLMVDTIERAEEDERAKRIQREARKASGKIAEFKIAKSSANSERIANHILEATKSLFRKGDLIANVALDPETFAMTLKDSTSTEINPKRLSAGERQLLATSILWGLSQATGQTLPTVIDTPLGRLDKSHRENLIKNYFPNASRQVILLSTDEEITVEQLDKLMPSVGALYHLTSTDKTNETVITEGYFK